MSARVRLVGTIVLVVFAYACSGPTPTAPEMAPAPVSGAFVGSEGASGCRTVKFNVSGFFPIFSVTGDLEGTTALLFAGDLKFTGNTIANGGIAHWTITSSVLGPMTFETAFDNRNIMTDRPGSSGTFFENTGKHRALAGVDKAKLTYHGTFDELIPAADHDYHGVICQ